MADWQPGPPRVLLITRNLPPLRGGMERLNRHIALELNGWARVTVIGPAGCDEHLPREIEVRCVPTRPLWKFLLLSAIAAWREAASGPAIVLAGSGLMAPAAVIASWRARAPCAAYVHGLDLVVQHPVYRWVWMAALRHTDAVLANSANTAELATRANVANGNVAVLHPGVQIPDLQAARDDTGFRRQHGLGDGPILLSVGRLTRRKGLGEFVAEVLPGLIAAYPRIRLVVIGDEAPDALRRDGAGAGDALDAQLGKLNLRDYVSRLGPCDEATLEAAYAAADVHVFPVRHVPGDVEGFGMVAIEAAAHGLPTVAFSVGGVPDAVSDGQSGYLVAPGDYAGFAARVGEVLVAGRDAPLRLSARRFARSFAWEQFGQRLRDAIKRIAQRLPLLAA